MMNPGQPVIDSRPSSTKRAHTNQFVSFNPKKSGTDRGFSCIGEALFNTSTSVKRFLAPFALVRMVFSSSTPPCQRIFMTIGPTICPSIPLKFYPCIYLLKTCQALTSDTFDIVRFPIQGRQSMAHSILCLVISQTVNC